MLSRHLIDGSVETVNVAATSIVSAKSRLYMFLQIKISSTFVATLKNSTKQVLGSFQEYDTSLNSASSVEVAITLDFEVIFSFKH
ncbi:hypothetical protein R6Q59_016893 [Mikania micrantha]